MNKIFYLSALVVLSVAGCKKNDNKALIQSQQFEINATNSTAWKYFSFAKNDTITVTNPMTSAEWDLAFQRYRVRTNSGLSGNGMGGAANSYQKLQAGFDAIKIVPDTASFEVDKSIEIAVQQGSAIYIVNPELYTWFNIELAAAGTQIVPTDYVYFIKTGTGKYAKVWFKSYYSATNVSGYVTFQYKYQPDGSKNLE